MSLKLDHFFILADASPLEAEHLATLGITQTYMREHEGQGTANRCYALANSTMEWLYIRDEEEARYGAASRLRFTERITAPGASRFGLVVRQLEPFTDTPYPGWDYQPAYFPDSWRFRVGSNTDTLQEPLCICMPWQLPEKQTNTDGVAATLTRLVLTVDVQSLSPVLQKFSEIPMVEITTGAEPSLAIELNHATMQKTLTVCEDPEVVVCW